ncbi:MAG: ribonuclease domain-containing protein [Jatrophihabitans sp.]|uniref:ribonuclease domain-containing protein n=1 Tax=Jatrophihabitans sp. TaxID=1932789 RepID=UPI003F7D1FD8
MRRVRRPLLALIALVVALLVGYAVRGSDSSPQRSTGPSPSVSADGRDAAPLSSLPPQVAATVRLVEQGGPFPYPRNDGVVFHNNEHHLPAERDGYYHEYTVPTPGSPDRGARRLIVGSDGTYWYTADHYESFVRVELDR